jgi:hypothetical protein
MVTQTAAWLLLYWLGPLTISVDNIASEAACRELGVRIQAAKMQEYRTDPFSCLPYDRLHTRSKLRG